LLIILKKFIRTFYRYITFNAVNKFD